MSQRSKNRIEEVDDAKNLTTHQLKISKLCVVGDSRAGKTSLLKVLRGLDFNAEQEPTCGVDSCMIDVRETESWIEIGRKDDNDSPKVVVMDFAGQRMYYLLHQPMLTEASTYYIIVVSLEYELNTPLTYDEDEKIGTTRLENLDHWLLSIHGAAPSAPIQVVCAKRDLVSEEVCNTRMKALRDHFLGKAYEHQINDNIICTSSKSGEGIEKVRKALQDCSKLDRYDQEVPLGWFKFLSTVKELVHKENEWQKHQEIEGSDINDLPERGHRRIDYSMAMQLAALCGVTKEDEVQRMLQKFHDCGLLMWRNRETMRNIVVLDPQWMIDQMTKLLCPKKECPRPKIKYYWSQLRKQGRLTFDLLPDLWPELKEDERKQVLHYMMHFGLVCNLRIQSNKKLFLVPSLLPSLLAATKSNEEEPEVWTKTTYDEVLQVSFISTNYKCNGETMNINEEEDWPKSRKFLPDTIFFRLVTMLVHEAKNVSDAFEHLYHDRVVIKSGSMRYLLHHYAKEQVLRLTVYAGPGCEHVPAAVMCKLKKYLDKLQDSFGVKYCFEAYSDDWRGENGWFLLEDLQQDSIWYKSATMESRNNPPLPLNIEDIKEAVVMIGLWDSEKNSLVEVGSGFIADKSKGLILTVAHIFYNILGENTGPVYKGLKGSKAIIGTFQKTKEGDDNDSVHFTYFADIITNDKDITNADAVVLQITSKIKKPFQWVPNQEPTTYQCETRVIKYGTFKDEKVKKLELEMIPKLADEAAIVGFNQSGEGRHKPGIYINYKTSIAKGYVSGTGHSGYTSVPTGASPFVLATQSEIIIENCPAHVGQAGGPCVNQYGKVIGILSRGDHTNRNKCYLAQASELEKILKKAKRRVGK